MAPLKNPFNSNQNPFCSVVELTERSLSCEHMLFGSLPATETSVSELLPPGLISFLLYRLIEFHPCNEKILFVFFFFHTSGRVATPGSRRGRLRSVATPSITITVTLFIELIIFLVKMGLAGPVWAGPGRAGPGVCSGGWRRQYRAVIKCVMSQCW